MLSGSVARNTTSTHLGRRRSSSLPTDLTSAATPQPERGVELASLERATASLSKACGGFARRARGWYPVQAAGSVETPYGKTGLFDILSQIRRQCKAYGVVDLTASVTRARGKVKQAVSTSNQHRADELADRLMTEWLGGINLTYPADFLLHAVSTGGETLGFRMSDIFALICARIKVRSEHATNVGFYAGKANQEAKICERGVACAIQCSERTSPSEDGVTPAQSNADGLMLPETRCANCSLKQQMRLVHTGDGARPLFCGL